MPDQVRHDDSWTSYETINLVLCCKLDRLAKNRSAALNTANDDPLDWKEFMRYG